MPTFTDLDFVADIELDDASVLVHRLGRPPVRLVLTSADPTTDAEITAAHDIHNDGSLSLASRGMVASSEARSIAAPN
ncbi:hypothetical protein ACRAWC_09310 [Leifsonia sp. L25]|uniref:hypothetical protein n=1 Tax=Leifsonia sp. L25 TaxID=3423957 RepID=UPI003D6834B6